MITRGNRAELPVLLVRPDDAATVLGISRTKVYELMASGRLHSIKIGRSRRIPMDSLLALVAGSASGSAA